MSLITLQKHWVRPTLLDFNDWLKQKDEAYDWIQKSQKARTEDNTNSLTWAKVASRTFAADIQTKTHSNFPSGLTLKGSNAWLSRDFTVSSTNFVSITSSVILPLDS